MMVNNKCLVGDVCKICQCVSFGKYQCQPGIQKQLGKYRYFMFDASTGLGLLEYRVLFSDALLFESG